ncbi:cob(I)yrinic acid a,c-diamide adenosyltransferase [Fodinicola feengrottensis]|uniref:Corrinoid adenosyltransferase n=1 Tax=Fodinicola feengrottensis TaxID=435914 RepID=A0ABP4RS54_9ACTN|nr:cob(I)yrinic acid a,c-diamide adenosyltransferase [Fodinicola feengrottensis]
MADLVLSRIYTRVGDDGTTGLGDGSRVPKTSVRLAAYADTDEANATIGVVLSLGNPAEDVRKVVIEAQNDLFDVGADLCTPIVEGDDRLRITEAYVQRLEGHCDTFNDQLPKLRSFILPGGSPAGALLHAARTVTRRAERSVWALLEAEPAVTNPLTGHYLNRLSDLLFILARTANLDTGDVLWQPGKKG